MLNFLKIIPSIFKKNEGLTLPEVILAIGIFSIIFGFVTINLGKVTRTTNVSSAIEVLISDLRSQQEKAMNGAGEGTSVSDFGIYFESDRYILFRGQIYSPGATSNVTVTLPENISITSVTFPQDKVVFASRSGEFLGYSTSTRTVTMANSLGNEQKTLRLNSYGVVDQVSN